MEGPGFDIRENVEFLAAQGAVALDGRLPAPMPYGLKVNGAKVIDLTHEFVIGSNLAAVAPNVVAK